MKRLVGFVCAIQAFLFAPQVLGAQVPDSRDKVAEGEYWRWEDGHPIKDTTQSWVIWRTKEGFEIENKLPPDKGAIWVAAIASGNMPATREFKEGAKNAAMVTEVRIQMDRDFHFVGLRSDGKSLKDTKPVLVADCAAAHGELACKGRLSDARAKESTPALLIYSPAGPDQYVALLRQANVESGQSKPVSFVLLEEVNNKLQLSQGHGVLRNEGRDKLAIGERAIEGEKFVLSIEEKNSPRQIILWASKQGLVFGMEDSRDSSGTQILLSKYKKYADF